MRLVSLLITLAACGPRPTIECASLDLEIPTPRGEVGGVWDDARRRLVLFGGDHGTPVECMARTEFVAETWAYWSDCAAFQELTPATSPPARGRHATALDAARGRMLIHGGRFREGTTGAYTLRDDAWAFDLATDTWTALATGGPSARTNHVAVVAGDRLVVYGGNTSTDGASFSPQGDVWTLDLGTNTWAEQTPTGTAPRPRLFHAAAVSADGGTLYLYGGGGRNAFLGPFYGDLWALDLNTWAWTSLHDGSDAAPLGRIWGNLLFDGERDRLVLWAGHDDGALGNTNEVWTFDLGARSWTRQQVGDVLDAPANGFCDFPEDFVVADLDAPERRNAGVASITGRGELIVFGGKSDCGLLNDVWTLPLAGGAWSNVSRATGGEICQRAATECETLCY